MLRFLSSLFTSAEDRGGGVDEALIEKAIERVVAGNGSAPARHGAVPKAAA